jgi:hypothetical protein
MNRTQIINLVEEAARMRGNEPLSREYIVDALERIDRGEVEVRTYMGIPSLRGIYETALDIERKRN